MVIIGIDLGTANSLACVYRDGKAELMGGAFGDESGDVNRDADCAVLS